MNVVESISLHAKFKGKRPALICGERRLNWTDFNALVDAIASSLIKKGLKKGTTWDDAGFLVCNCRTKQNRSSWLQPACATLRVSTTTLHLPSCWLENSTTIGAKMWILTGEWFQRLMKIL